MANEKGGHIERLNSAMLVLFSPLILIIISIVLIKEIIVPFSLY